MNRPDQSVPDLEAATDQLVDEICQRLSALYALVDLSLDEVGPPVAVVRRHAAELVTRCAGAGGQGTATAIARAFWPLRFGHAPAPWWETPLGELLADADADASVDAPTVARRGAR